MNVGGKCGDCAYFPLTADEFEKALPGLLILSSGRGDSRGDQGICRLHEQMTDPSLRCSDFETRESKTASPRSAG